MCLKTKTYVHDDNLCTSRPRKLRCFGLIEAKQLDLFERINFKSDRYSSITQAILSIKALCYFNWENDRLKLRAVTGTSKGSSSSGSSFQHMPEAGLIQSETQTNSEIRLKSD